MVAHLWFVVAHLTDSFKAAKACQGGNRDWKVIPLNNCKWIELSIYNNQSRHRAACKQLDGKFMRYGSRE